MSHAKDDIDFDQLQSKGLPKRFCKSNWRRVVFGSLLVAVTVLAVAIEQWVSAGSSAPATPPPITVSSATITLWDHTPNRAVAMNLAPANAMATGDPTLTNSAGGSAPVGGGMPVAGTAGGGTEPMIADPSMRFVDQANRTTFHNAAEAVRPAVVGIRAGATMTQGPWRVGSGVVVDSHGFVLTCNHVVANATSITVSRFRHAGEQLAARLVAVEEDLALLQVMDPVPMPAATLADSNALRVGDWVIALGHPFNLGLTVTAGIVGRRNATVSLPSGDQYTDVIQTDAPINEGSSGGPLVDRAGNVVGMNTAIYAPTGVFSGAGFAIPSNRLRAFLSRALPSANAGRPAPQVAAPVAAGNFGTAAGWGLAYADLGSQPGFAGTAGGGVVVTNVAANSPAAQAQLLVGDVIVSIDGQALANRFAAAQAFAEVGPRQRLTLRVVRQGRTGTMVMVPM